MKPFASASSLWSKLAADLPADRGRVCETRIRKELLPEELAIWEGLPLERRIGLLCHAMSPWNAGSVAYIVRQLNIIREEQRSRPAAAR